MLAARADLSPKDPQVTVLHRIVREHMETFLARRSAQGEAMPRFVVDELRGYVRCGVLAHGAARFRCECGKERLAALSCKGRGFCPRCGGRRMTEIARHWVRSVLPHVRIRQWVLSLPFEMRAPLAYHHELTLAVHAVAARAIEGWYRAKGKTHGIEHGMTGSITVVQRFGSDAALNIHFHSLFLDGVLSGRRFSPIEAPTASEMEKLCRTIAHRTTRMLERRAMDHDEPQERALARALSRSARRQGATPHRPENADGDDDASAGGGKLKARVDGFDLEATTVVPQDDRERLEQLARYLLRPPLADHRLRLLHDGRVALRLKKPWRDGTDWITMDPDTFLERLCSLVPRPRANTILYRGVLAPHAKLREHVVPRPDDEVPRPKNATWCALMTHGLGVDVLACPCGKRMKFICVVFDRKGLGRLLRAAGLPDRIEPIRAARAPPQADLDFGA